ncbi:MAG: helix-turn-helix domain-containing protein [Chloroflexi bacterium]|nr:helix-turn-helix domain-containing protein [Chloroflexota bacterium]
MSNVDEQDNEDLSASQILGKRIKDARTRKGLSQAHLGKAIGKDQRAVYEYEIGERRISVTELPLLASELGVSVLYFFQDAISQDDLDQALIAAFHALPSDDLKQKAIRIIALLGADVSSLPPLKNI